MAEVLQITPEGVRHIFDLLGPDNLEDWASISTVPDAILVPLYIRTMTPFTGNFAYFYPEEMLQTTTSKGRHLTKNMAVQAIAVNIAKGYLDKVDRELLGPEEGPPPRGPAYPGRPRL
jgi:hypothetical protein